MVEPIIGHAKNDGLLGRNWLRGRAGAAVRVLDIGCGVASTLTAFHPDYTCVGYDLSADAIEFARAISSS